MFENSKIVLAVLFFLGSLSGIFFLVLHQIGFFLQKVRIIRYDRQIRSQRLINVTMVKFLVSGSIRGTWRSCNLRLSSEMQGNTSIWRYQMAAKSAEIIGGEKMKKGIVGGLILIAFLTFN